MNRREGGECGLDFGVLPRRDPAGEAACTARLFVLLTAVQRDFPLGKSAQSCSSSATAVVDDSLRATTTLPRS